MPQRRTPGWSLVLLAGLLSTLLVAGCVPVQTVSTPADRPSVSPDAKKVLPGSACLELGETEKPAVTREDFVRKVNELLTGERFNQARILICRYPDVALEALRNATNEQARDGAMQFIAQVHDHQCNPSPQPSPSGRGGATAQSSAQGWQAFLQDRAANPSRYAAYAAVRQQFLDLMRSGKVRDALALHLTKDARTPLLAIDAHRLLGEALLLDDKASDAVAAFATALKQAQTDHPYQAAQIMLLLGEAQRRAGKNAEGTGAWQQAVLLAAKLLTRPVPVIDPILWERAAYLRPVQCAWPEPVIKQLTPPGNNASLPGQPAAMNGLGEAWLWAHIGQWRLDRNEAQAALVALKRAESLSLDQRFQEQIQLSQARAMAQLQQPATAMAILVRLAGKSDSPCASPALAMLGALKLRDGNSQQALVLLKKAVEQSPSTTWQGRGEAEADLALAYLMSGDEDNGLRWLHSGQQKFEAAHDHEMLLQSLENEANYLDHIKKPEDAGRIRERMKVLEINQ